MSKATASSAVAADPHHFRSFSGDTDVTLEPWPTIPPERVISGNPSHQGNSPCFAIRPSATASAFGNALPGVSPCPMRAQRWVTC